MEAFSYIKLLKERAEFWQEIAQERKKYIDEVNDKVEGLLQENRDLRTQLGDLHNQAALLEGAIKEENKNEAKNI